MNHSAFRRLLSLATLCFIALSFVHTSSAAVNSYDYPFDNALVSTILGTPSDFKAELPKRIPFKVYKTTVLSDREVPDVFWYQDKMKFGLIAQKKAAPLIFIIAGTGGDYKSGKLLVMARAFYQAGFHVLALSSPTHPNFLVTASSTMVPGDPTTDAQDIYKAMQMAYKKVNGKVQVTEFHLAGYSLGGAQSAFVSYLDEQQRVFSFTKVLMINPPVSLFNSVDILDRMLTENIPGGLDNFNVFWRDFWQDMGDYYEEGVFVQFNEDLLYKVYQDKVHDHEKPDPGRMQAMIGTAFRMSSAAMIFSSDVMLKSNVIIPRDVTLGRNDSLVDFSKVAHRMGFTDYFEEMLAPYYLTREPQATKEELKRRTSLESIRGYLAGAEKIGVAHNEDDIILAPGEIEFFREVFGDRAKIYPKGGHCGNMAYPENVAYIIGFFKDTGGKP
jgi:hypothetical protein